MGLLEALKPILMFAGLFAAVWLGKRLIKWFGPIIKLWGYKPWK